MTRKCSSCRAIKPTAEFHKNAKRCKPCNRIYCQAHYIKNREKRIAEVTAYRERNLERDAACKRRYYERNAQKLIDRAIVYQRRYLDRHARRKARQLQAIPSWADQAAIRLFYLNRPAGYHVDHIIPLVAKEGNVHIACGLHCEANLQYLPARENCRKRSSIVSGSTVSMTSLVVGLDQGSSAT